MKHEPVSPARRRAVNVSLDEATVVAAKELGITISQVCQTALAAEVKSERIRRFTEENWEAIQAHNAWVDKHGLPLARYRMF